MYIYKLLVFSAMQTARDRFCFKLEIKLSFNLRGQKVTGIHLPGETLGKLSQFGFPGWLQQRLAGVFMGSQETAPSSVPRKCRIQQSLLRASAGAPTITCNTLAKAGAHFY